MKVSDILFKAREIQLERGRAVRQMQDEKGRVCMVRALELAAPHYQTLHWEAYDFLRTTLSLSHIPDFSDCMCKTKYDMAAAFEIVACCAAAEGN